MNHKIEIYLLKTLHLLPIILIAVSFLSVLYKYVVRLIDYVFCPLQTWSTEFNWVVWGNAAGFSLITNIAFLYIFWFTKLKYCLFTKCTPFSLILVNLVNIWGYYNPGPYNQWYEVTILSVTLTPLLIYQLNKNLNR